MADKDLSSMEHLKARSRYLRGNLAEDMADPLTGGVSEDSAQLLKFHGMYLQDNRDLRPERTRKMLEKAFGFMIRIRLPGGVIAQAVVGGIVAACISGAQQFHAFLASER